MGAKKYGMIILIVQVFFVLSIGNASAGGKITGYIYDSQTSEPLIGANAYIQDTGYGAATDLSGRFVIFNVPPGMYVLKAKYMGYDEKSVDIILQDGETIEQIIELDFKVIEGQAVQITAQAEGQMQAINEQLSNRTVTNVVSKKQIMELPEANAAEAVGRLPGVSLERSGGEGNKIVIRGMAAKYALIQIDGVNMTATGQQDRSTDLSMISPYMLEGIELTKSVMANQEATATGGIVNFKIKNAPEKPSFNVIAQGGYNNLHNTYNDYKLSVGGSKRFYSNLLGIYAQVDYENKDAGSQQLGGVNFYQENLEAPVETNKMELMDIYRKVKRLGATVVMDYKLPSTNIKFSNFYSRINREETQFKNNYNYEEQGFSINYTDIPERWLTVLTNSLQIDQQWRNWGMNARFSHSYSENILPAEIKSGNNNSPGTPFSSNRSAKYNVNLDPETIPDSMVISMDDAVQFMHLGGMDIEESEIRERDLAGELNLSYNLNITDKVNVKLNVGGKYRHKSKEYDRTVLDVSNAGGDQAFRNLVYDYFEDELSEKTRSAWEKNNMYILLSDFLDKDYEGEEFLDGRYDFGNVFDKEKYRKIYDLVMDTYDPESSGLYSVVARHFVDTHYKDFDGTEDYHAFYLMPEIGFGNSLMFIPGVRYEANRTEYTGYRGSRIGILRDWALSAIDTVTKVRTNEFVLPMIQVFYKPTDWLTVKTGYTHTLQRPNYNNIMPGWVIGSQGQIDDLSNFRLKPELSKNVDLQMSLFLNKLGLVSVGGFYKEISDMIFWTGQTVILDTAYFELPSLMNHQRAAYATNNPNDAYNYGFEVELQSHFWYLPGLLKGLVLNVNYTQNHSKAKYLRSVVKSKIDPATFRATLYSEDTTYTSPMISQPDHLLNLNVGYDYKGFSVRWAMRYKSHIFSEANWYEKLRVYSTDFYRYDLSIKQKLPVNGMEFFLNVNNLTGEKEKTVINHRDFTKYLEDYGRSANLGIRWQL